MRKSGSRALALLLSLLIAFGGTPMAYGEDPELDDPVLRWNAIALNAMAQDANQTYGPSLQNNPGAGSRSLGIIHAAIYDAVNSITRTHEAYRTLVPIEQNSASVDAAVAYAASIAMKSIFTNQTAVIDAELVSHMALIPDGEEKDLGRIVGTIVGNAIVAERTGDGSENDGSYAPNDQPGFHRVDPLNPSQPYWGPLWGEVEPFALASPSQFRAPEPPAITSPEYAVAYNEVKPLGGDGITTPTDRTEEETHIGLFWAYDGSKLLGVPPRFYNQIARQIAADRGNTVEENARMFGLINIAQADAGIAAWESKYYYDYWRPVLAIREADEGTGPSGLGDGNPDTEGDAEWTPLGAPASNQSGPDFTPPFPAYPSGHATFGASVFRSIANFYGTDEIAFTVTSDELNGVTTDNDGNVRPLSPRSFERLSDAAAENGRSRIYLGIHWQFDATSGIDMGNSVADYVYANYLRPAEIDACDTEGIDDERPDCIDAGDYDLTVVGSLTDSVIRGSTFEASFTAENAGPGNAEDATISAELPAGIALNSVLAGSCTMEGSTLLCSGIDVASDTSATVTLEFTVPEESSCPAQASITPSVVSTEGKDYYAGNDTSETLTVAIECEPENDLAVSLSAPATSDRNDTLTFVVRGENRGPSTAGNPEISVPLLAGLTFAAEASDQSCAQNGSEVVCDLNAMSPEESQEVTVAFTPLPTIACGTELGFEATIISGERELNPDDNRSATAVTEITCTEESPEENENDDEDDEGSLSSEDQPSQSPGATRGKGTTEAKVALALLFERNGMQTQANYGGNFHVRGSGNSLMKVSVVASDRVEIIDGYTRAERNVICSMKRYMEEQDPRNRKTPEFRHWLVGEIAKELHKTREQIDIALANPIFCN